MKDIFIAGTDTNVGKTIVSAWLCNILKADYFKPIQSGVEEQFPRTDSEFMQSINLGNYIFPEIYKFRLPLSPHISAKLDNQEIDLSKIQIPQHNNRIIVEGAGGLYVPLNNQDFIIDLIKKLDIATIIVARTALGTINHTLLTVNALRQNNINILGVILVGEENLANKTAIQTYGKVKVLATLPIFSDKNNWQGLKEFGHRLNI